MGVVGKLGQNGSAMQASIELDAVPESAAEARHFIATMLEVWGCDDPEQVVGLLTSEVVTNAIQHAGGQIRVHAALGEDGTMRVETFDESPDVPLVRCTDPHATSGRGILIIQGLARRWGVDACASHKVVWFELPTTPRAPLG
jgi:anti-sigma regulatory factor (Ser/Thr protein kinase)